MVMWLDGYAIVSVNQRKKVRYMDGYAIVSVNQRKKDIPEVVNTQQDIWCNVAIDGQCVRVNAECAECVLVFFTETIWFEQGS
ncbi:hypothetical protein RB195_009644 [Necator americanus]|uniref:Uncharacterized protein n=1 Tax=Necator americanus TaxID=51031 RepID=A0ABR1CVI7_NECAM